MQLSYGLPCSNAASAKALFHSSAADTLQSDALAEATLQSGQPPL